MRIGTIEFYIELGKLLENKKSTLDDLVKFCYKYGYIPKIIFEEIKKEKKDD